ncbi:hypothetical protein [Phenylobacterium sp. SCN 70-31]|uniref:hypothetical protein n=1 Tax=Phenylobacterium sp. SCN 70-31 TaxID=1660129 RepID=UPI00086E6B72|nr:hypothetical protein [Phenylobacterium sp. SCN 70-31]ODT86695.1 MAG: hypothetical protein ABS78_15545 [Phenylobacterium sp. SCN 70-31]
MVHRTYAGLGSPDLAIPAFNKLTPWAKRLLELQGQFDRFTAGWLAFGIAIEALETTAYHFTRRPRFYERLSEEMTPAPGTSLLGQPAEVIKTFIGLTPYHDALISMLQQCRPMGRDYMAILIAKDGLDSAAYHFTREDRFFAPRSDSTGPIRGPAGHVLAASSA